MTLRKKTLVIIGLTIILLLVILYTGLRFQMVSNFVQILLASLAVGLVSLVLLEWQVLSRLTSLSKNVRQITTSGNLSGRVTLAGSDELTSLAGDINTVLSRLTEAEAEVTNQRTRTNLLYEISTTLGAELNFTAIMARAIELAGPLGAEVSEIYVMADSGEIYFKSSIQARNNLDAISQHHLVHHTLTEGLAAEALAAGQPMLMQDGFRAGAEDAVEPSLEYRSAMCAPLTGSQGQLQGAILFTHSEPGRFCEQDLTLLKALASHLIVGFS